MCDAAAPSKHARGPAAPAGAYRGPGPTARVLGSVCHGITPQPTARAALPGPPDR